MNNIESAVWLDEFYNSFEAEARGLYKIEPFWRVCQSCPDGHCCSHMTYSVQSGVGNPFIVEDWERMLKYLRDVLSLDEKNKIIKKILSSSRECIFVSQGRCSIHPARPWSCRTHPYTVSFHPNSGIFPVGELALPSCPALASAFGLKIDQMLIQKAAIMEKRPGSNLVKIKLKKHKPVWMIDATTYIEDYVKHSPPADRSDSDWLKLFALAREVGGGQGELLAGYVEKVTERKSGW
jgi:Fe-S-cluster containining protein